MHKSLERQIKKATGADGTVVTAKLITLVEAAYLEYERTIKIQKHATELMSQELNELNEAVRRDRDQTLAESQKRFELAVNSTTDGMWDWNVKNDKLWISSRSREMLGYGEERSQDQGISTWLTFIAEEDKPQAQCFLEACVNLQRQAPVTLKFLHADSSIRYLMCRATAVQDDSGKVIRVVGMQTDVTPLLLMHDELRRAQDLAEKSCEKATKAAAAKSEFLANMSHEIRTPLNGIIGLTSLLADSPLDPDQQQSVQAILRSGENLMFLLNDILDFSKMEAGQLALEEIPFNLDDTLGGIIALLSPLASKKGIVLEYKYHHGAPVGVIGDPTRISQIFTNLTTNALKFTDSGSVSLDVKYKPARNGGPSTFQITVADTGVGMSSDIQERLFKKFSQGDASMSRKYGGTGLGLAISGSLIEIMCGTIVCDSAEGAGTSFTVEIPLGIVDTTALIESRKILMPHQHNGSDFSSSKALVVDDHPVNLLFTTKLLKKMGFNKIDEAVNGIEAIKILAESGLSYDVILMDCQMPEMDGFATAEKIRSLESAAGAKLTPIIAMTANAMEGDRERCLKSGMNDYVSKPVNPVKLHSALTLWMREGISSVRSQENHTSGYSSSNSAVVDTSLLLELTEGDPAEESLFVNAYLSGAEESLVILRSQLKSESDSAVWRAAAHKLNGSSAQIGAHALSELCLSAECGSGSLETNWPMCLESIEKSFDDVKAFFLARELKYDRELNHTV